MTPEDTIYKAIEIIERDGWHQGSLFAGEHTDRFAARHAPVCAMGALYRATYGTCHGWTVATLAKRSPASAGAFRGAYDRLIAVVSRTHRTSVPVFNDADTTTVEDVLLALKEAANNET